MRDEKVVGDVIEKKFSGAITHHLQFLFRYGAYVLRN